MASREVLDFERLLAPIPGDNPTGFDVRENRSFDSLYTQFRDTAASSRKAELEAGDTLDDLGQKRKPAPPEWGKVLDLGIRILSEQSKDLEVAILLAEPLVRRFGFAGLRDGFRLVRELVERYWEGLFPPLDSPDGVLERVDALGRLNESSSRGNLVTPILRVPLTAGKSCGPYSLLDYRQAAAIEAITDPDKRARRLEEGGPSLDQFHKAVAETPPEHFQQLLEDITQCADELARLSLVLDERCGSANAPAVGEIREAIDACRRKVEEYVTPIAATEPAAPGEMGAAVGTDGGVPGAGGLGAVRNREEAFQVLLRIADFFRRTEPQSPISFFLEETVRLGRMSLPELFQELTADPTTLSWWQRLLRVSGGGSNQ